MLAPQLAIRSMFQAISVTLILSSISGCRVGDPHTVFVDNGRLSATVVLSTYAERPCINGVHTEIVAAAADRISNDFFPSGPFRQMVDNSRRTNSDFPGHFGQIFSFPALPGDYFMIPYKEGELDIPALTRRKFRFTAVAGATVYIGEFHLSSASECGPGFAMEVRDESDRDLAAIGRLKPGPVIGRTIKNIAVAQ